MCIPDLKNPFFFAIAPSLDVIEKKLRRTPYDPYSISVQSKIIFLSLFITNYVLSM